MIFPFSFVFLQLYYDGLMPIDDSRPILLPTEQVETQRSIRLLDLIKPYDTHKIGILYVRKGQTMEQDILSNTFGSLRYMQFLSVRLWNPLVCRQIFKFPTMLHCLNKSITITFSENKGFRWFNINEYAVCHSFWKDKEPDVSGSGLPSGVGASFWRRVPWRYGHKGSRWENCSCMAWRLTTGEVIK